MLTRALSLFSRAAVAGLFPPICSFCGTRDADPHTLICGDCLEAINWIHEPFCSQCGRFAPGLHHSPGRLCGSCLSSEPPFESARYGAHYNGSLRKAIIAFKFYGALHLLRPLAHLLLQTYERHFLNTRFDAIVAVPMHEKRLISRGFNHVLLLGEKLATETNIPLDRTVLRKIKDTAPQVGLTRAQRKTNLRGSMHVADPGRIKGKRVLLLDDVSTSGATLAEAAGVLKRSGASQVHGLVLALKSDTNDDHSASV